MDRRRFLARVAGVGAPFATGCLGGPGAGTPTPTDRSTSTETATPTPTATPTETATPTPTPRPGPDAVVRLQNSRANPEFAYVEVGGTVEWVNEDPTPHELVSAKFNDEAREWEFGPVELKSGGSVTHTFDAGRGQYEYYGIRKGQDTLCGAITVEVALGEGLPCE